MSRAGSIHKDTSGPWSFVVDTAPLGAPRRGAAGRLSEREQRCKGVVQNLDMAACAYDVEDLLDELSGDRT